MNTDQACTLFDHSHVISSLSMFSHQPTPVFIRKIHLSNTLMCSKKHGEIMLSFINLILFKKKKKFMINGKSNNNSYYVVTRLGECSCLKNDLFLRAFRKPKKIKNKK